MDYSFEINVQGEVENIIEKSVVYPIYTMQTEENTITKEVYY